MAITDKTSNDLNQDQASSSELWFLELPHEEIVTLICLLEGHEGLAVPRVLEKERGIVELLVAPDLAPELAQVLAEINRLFPVRRIPRPEGISSIADEISSPHSSPGLMAPTNENEG